MPSSVSSNTTTSSPSYYQVLSQQTTPPKDTYYVVYASFFLAGLAMLIPWNALITAEEYFGRKFGGTPYADNFLNYITLNFTFVNFITLAIIVKYQSRFTLATQIFGALALNIIAFLYFTVTAQFTIGTNEDFFYVTMFLTMMSAVGTSYMQNGMFGISAQFPPIYILAVMSGQGVAGVVVAVSSMISAGINAAENKKLTDEAANLSGFYYFLFGTLVLVISAGFLVLLQKNPFYIYYSTTVQDESVTTSSGATAKSSIEESEESGPDRKDALLTRESTTLNFASSSSAQECQPFTPLKTSMLQISWQIRSYAFSCFLTFVVTLAVFPPLTASVGPVDKQASEMYKALFVPAHFLVFNTGDWIGRVLPSVRPFHIVNSKAIFLATCLRVLFIVGFLFCNVNGGKDNSLPDWTFFVLMILFSITNGWLGSLTMMAGPAAVHPVDSSVAGTLMSFYLTFGLTVGALLSFLIRMFVCECNPFLKN